VSGSTLLSSRKFEPPIASRDQSRVPQSPATAAKALLGGSLEANGKDQQYQCKTQTNAKRSEHRGHARRNAQSRDRR
jgi:hypothetical protein